MEKPKWFFHSADGVIPKSSKGKLPAPPPAGYLPAGSRVHSGLFCRRSEILVARSPLPPMVPTMKILPRKTFLACLLALVAFAPSGFSQDLTIPDPPQWEIIVPRPLRDPYDPFCNWVRGNWNCAVWFPRVLVTVEDSCGNENLLLIDDKKGELIAQHVLEPGEELEEIVSITPSEITIKVNASNTDALLALFQTYLSENPTPGVIEAQVVTASSHFPELLFGTPSRAAAFDRWYDEVYKVSSTSTESSEMLRTYRILRAEKALQMTEERVFGAGDAEQLVGDGNEAPSERRALRKFFTAEVSPDGATFKLRSYAPKKTAKRKAQ
jgi:hypothetical protein